MADLFVTFQDYNRSNELFVSSRIIEDVVLQRCGVKGVSGEDDIERIEDILQRSMAARVPMVLYWRRMEEPEGNDG